MLGPMDISMPPFFPIEEFRKFGRAAATVLIPAPRVRPPKEEAEASEMRRQSADSAWQAVRYRYRLCSESNNEFQTLRPESGKTRQPGELHYKLERCIYTFFMAGLSVFESFAFCLYFLGEGLCPAHFPHVANPKRITLTATHKAFAIAYPSAPITAELTSLESRLEFATVDAIRNVLAHRLAGMPASSASYSRKADGTLITEWFQETWHIPGVATIITFDEDMLQRFLDQITGMLNPLVSAAREFAEQHQRK
jgi:hypothetical protein